MNFKKFYLKFKELTIPQTVSEEFKKQKQQTLSDELSSHFQKGQTPPAQFELRLLPWSHYERLIRVEDKKAREWYAKKAFEQGWSYRTLNRNINTLYYERLLMSKKKQPVVNEMQDKTKAYQQDKLEYIKSPVVLEFLGLPEDTSLAESKLETAIINNLEKFLMEMGKGYALVARQQHIRTEENDYYIDLVFYNYLIKSFILVDLKVNRITYQDVGQMDMYLQMYDKIKKRNRRQPYHRHHPLYRNRFGCGTILYPRKKRPDVRSKIQVIPARQGRLEKRNRTTERTVSNGSS